MENITSDIKQLSIINPYKSLMFILIEWGWVMLFLYIYQFEFNLFLIFYPLIWLIMGTRMYALYSLLHDGIHFLLFKNKKMNDFISKIFLAWPLFIDFESIRKKHFEHHKHLMTEKDPEFQLTRYPEFQFPMKKIKFFMILFLDLLGINFIRYEMMRLKQKISSKNRYRAFVYLIFIFICCSIFIFITYKINLFFPFLAIWILPYITVFQAINRLRAYTEHFNLPPGKKVRTLNVHPLLKYFFSPYNLGFHEAHHRYSHIPHYNLSKLHSLLKNKFNLEMYEESNLVKLIQSIYKN